MQTSKLWAVLLLCGSVGLSATTPASTAPEQKPPIPEAVNKALHEMLGEINLKQLQIKKLPELDVYEIIDSQHVEVFYISASGRYLIQGGSVFDIKQQGLNITEQQRNNLRLTVLSQLDIKNMIIFKPEKEAKHIVSVFTDVDCFYCSKLHSEIKDFNNADIEIRYLAFPRAGLKSETYQKMVAVWCADDPNKAMTDAKAGKAIDTSKTCETKIPQQYELAQKLGVTGTPAMILPTGELLPGYLPAKRLAAYLDEQKTQAKK